MQYVTSYENPAYSKRLSQVLGAVEQASAYRSPAMEPDSLRQYLPEGAALPKLRDIHLTKRERDCLHLIAEGQSNVEIAGALGLGLPTVATHINRARAKLDAKTRAQAVAHYMIACLL